MSSVEASKNGNSDTKNVKFANTDWGAILVDAPTAGEVFSLQSVLRHFIRLKYIERSDLHKKTSLRKDQATSFLNRIQGDKADSDQYKALVPFAANVFEKHAREIKDTVILHAISAAIRQPTAEAASEDTTFEVKEDLASWIRVDSERILDATRMLGGMWLITRLSTSSRYKQDVAEYNVSLVNIDPSQIDEDLRLPRFKHYVNGKNKDNTHVEVFEGYVMVDDRHVYLFGRKRKTNSLQPELFSFRYVPPEKKKDNSVHKPPTINGHGNSVASSHGQIGVYFIAEFVEGSDSLSEAGFDAKKDELVSKIGVFTEEQLAENELIQKTEGLQSLLDRSASHEVFKDE